MSNQIWKYLSDYYLLAKIIEYNISYLTISQGVFMNGSHLKDIATEQLYLPSELQNLHFNYMIGEEKINQMK